MLRLAIVLTCVALQDKGRLPDANAIRAAAKRAGKPCVLLRNVTVTEELKLKTVGAVSDAAAAAFCKEFGVEPGAAWVVVLDGKGETLASAAAPKQLGDALDGWLKRTASLQALERSWKKDPKKRDEYLARLDEAGAWEKSVPIWEGIANDPATPAADRDTARIRAFLAKRASHGEAWHALVKSGEALAVEFADHALGKEILAKLHGLMTLGFDIPSKILASNARMAAAASEAGKAAPAMKVEWTGTQRILGTVGTGGVKTQKSELDDAVAAAQRGDAAKTIAFFSKPPYDKDPQYAWWVEEARAKQ